MKHWYISIFIITCSIVGYALWFKASGATQATQFYILTTSYNNAQKGPDGVPLCIANIKSVERQKNQNWHMVIIDDASSDGTGHLIQQYITAHNLADKVTLIRNAQRCGAMENIYCGIHRYMPNNDAVIVSLDGDDELLHDGVLDKLAKEYSNPAIWLTYGNFIFHPSGKRGFCQPFPKEVIEKRAYRQYHFISSHLRTFKVWLFKKIRREDCMCQGQFFKTNWDLAIMFPMLEMASPDHFVCIQEPLYIYKETPINDFKVTTDEFRMQMMRHIRSLPAYAPINR